MNALALVVAVAALGGDDGPVNYKIETAADKQQQYTIQVEPDILRLVAGGEEIHSEVPLEAGQVHRLCLRVGMTKPVHTPAGDLAFKQLLVSASRWAATRLTPADDPPTILWTSRGNPEPLYTLRYGYQPDAEGKLAYYMQIDPAVLRTLAAGDEIYAPIDPAAGRPDRFVVSITKKDLPPRIAPQQQVTPLPLATPTQFQPPAQPSLTGGQPRGNQYQSPPVEAPRLGAGGAGGGGGPNGNYETYGTYGAGGTGAANRGSSSFNPSYSPQGGAFSSPGATPQSNTLTSQGGALSSQGGAFNPQSGSYSPQVDHRQVVPGASAPPLQVADSRGYGPGGAGFGTNGNYEPYGASGASGAYRPGTTNQGYAPPATGFGAPQENRLASLPPPPVANQPAGAGLPPVTPAGSLAAPVAPLATIPQKESWGIFVVVLFALFFSIGGNLYLAWTALEFHNRYRSAIDRLRSAARNS